MTATAITAEVTTTIEIKAATAAVRDTAAERGTNTIGGAAAAGAVLGALMINA